ncbi:MAG: hypothetical protein JW702_08235 [Clostridiales bacterium]|nr:hypothetical protein [Clostridiales bacterium]
MLSCNAQNKQQKWIEDIEYIQEELPQKQKDFYKLIDSTDFTHNIETLKTNLDKLKDYEILFELQRIIAGMNVAHNTLRFPYTKYLSRLPIEVAIFDDGVFITNAKKGLKKNIGQKVISINNIPIDTINNKLSCLIPHENDYWLNHKLPELIKNPFALDYMNIGDHDDTFNFHFDNGVDLSVKKRFFPIKKEKPKKTPIYLKNTLDNYWFEMVNDSLFFIQYNHCRELKKYSIVEFVKDISEVLEISNPSTLIIDLRHNSGGNSGVIKPLIEYLISNDFFNSKKIYACIGRNTFSSGKINALNFCRNGAILIGEPTGGSPISYGEVANFKLPNSKSRVQYSIKFFNLRNCENKYFKNGTNTIEPHIRIPVYSTDYFDDKDKILEYIINDN